MFYIFRITVWDIVQLTDAVNKKFYSAIIHISSMRRH